jgi:hypothetical protein
MVARKRRKFETKTLLKVLLVALIVVGIIYVILTPSEEKEEVISVERLLLNKDVYDGGTVTVRGIYQSLGGNHVLTPPTTDASPDPEGYIFLDLSNINLTQYPAIEEITYMVRGTVEVEYFGAAFEIQLIAESFRKQ